MARPVIASESSEPIWDNIRKNHIRDRFLNHFLFIFYAFVADPMRSSMATGISIFVYDSNYRLRAPKIYRNLY